VRIIGRCENQRDLGHVPQLFCHTRVDKSSDFAKTGGGPPALGGDFHRGPQVPSPGDVLQTQFSKLQALLPVAFQTLNAVGSAGALACDI
jgi:hypothetical protein